VVESFDQFGIEIHPWGGGLGGRIRGCNWSELIGVRIRWVEEKASGKGVRESKLSFASFSGLSAFGSGFLVFLGRYSTGLRHVLNGVYAGGYRGRGK
jgi:hypothetical protein